MSADDLPKYMEARPMKRGGVSYRVRLKDGRKVTLGRNLDEALAAYAKMMPAGASDSSTRLARELLQRHRKGASARRIAFDLTEEDVVAMLKRAGGRCEVTNKRFGDDKPPGSRIRPWAPSIDRRDSSVGYTATNCRLVCAYVNVAMNRFGDDLLVELIEAIVRREVRQALLSHFPRKRRSLGAAGNAGKPESSSADAPSD